MTESHLQKTSRLSRVDHSIHLAIFTLSWVIPQVSKTFVTVSNHSPMSEGLWILKIGAVFPFFGSLSLLNIFFSSSVIVGILNPPVSVDVVVILAAVDCDIVD